jgi:hypothetical protein
MKTMSRNKFGGQMLLVIWAAIVLSACGANEGLLKAGKENSIAVNAQPPRTQFEADMDAMKTAGFIFVYVLRRKDGAPMDAQDRSLIKAQTVDTNRRVATDNDHAFIVGSNFELGAPNISALSERFLVDTHFDPAQANTNANANSAK